MCTECESGLRKWSRDELEEEVLGAMSRAEASRATRSELEDAVKRRRREESRRGGLDGPDLPWDVE